MMNKVQKKNSNLKFLQYKLVKMNKANKPNTMNRVKIIIIEI